MHQLSSGRLCHCIVFVVPLLCLLILQVESKHNVSERIEIYDRIRHYSMNNSGPKRNRYFRFAKKNKKRNCLDGKDEEIKETILRKRASH